MADPAMRAQAEKTDAQPVTAADAVEGVEVVILSIPLQIYLILLRISSPSRPRSW